MGRSFDCDHAESFDVMRARQDGKDQHLTRGVRLGQFGILDFTEQENVILHPCGARRGADLLHHVASASGKSLGGFAADNDQ